MAIHNLVNILREKKIGSIPFTLWIKKERRFSKILPSTCILSLYEQGEFLTTVKAKIFESGVIEVCNDIKFLNHFVLMRLFCGTRCNAYNHVA